MSITVVLISLAHLLIDSFALFIQPLWPDLQARLMLGGAGVTWIFVLWNMTTSVSQLAFALLGDRFPSRWMVWVGPLLAVACLGAVGSVQSVGGLCLLLIVGGLGVGLFHPEAAAMVGGSAPDQRGRAMSIFVLGGTIGQAIGPAFSGFVTTHHGLEALGSSVFWGLPLVAAFAWVIGRTPGPSLRPRTELHLSARPASTRTLVLVLAIGVSRVIPIMGVLLGIAFTVKARGGSNEEIGFAQAVFQIMSGVGVFGCAVLMQRSTERVVLWLMPLFALPPLVACGLADYWSLLFWLALAGLALGGATPVLISYAQRLLPQGERLASSITMGVSWGLGGAVSAGLVNFMNWLEHPEWSFFGILPFALVSSLLCAFLPAPEESDADAPAEPIPAPVTG